MSQYAPVKTARRLVSGSGNVWLVGSNILTFDTSQNFKEGATVYSIYYGCATIKSGSDKVWMAKVIDTLPPWYWGAFYRSDASSSRQRGGTGDASGIIVPRARHFVYVSYLDNAGNPDCFTYIDTLFPEKGIHPYTKDRCVGSLLAQSQRQVDGINITAEPFVVNSSGVIGKPDLVVPSQFGFFTPDMVTRLAAVDQGPKSF